MSVTIHSFLDQYATLDQALIEAFINRILPRKTPLDLYLKQLIVIDLDPLWVYQDLWRYTRQHCVKFSILGTAWLESEI